VGESRQADTSRPVYVAHCLRSDGWWAVEISDGAGVHLRGGNTQARRLDDVERMVREVISLLLDVPEDSFDVRLEAELPAEVRAEVESSRALRAEAERAHEAARTAYANAAADLVRRQGLTLRDAGRILGLSYQRVHQLLGERPKA
jgi:hypothetical protein